MSKLVPLVQGLAHQVHLFLVEYNKYNHLQLSLPGYKPKNGTANLKSSSSSSSSSSDIPEDVLHQQRLLLQNCDRLKLTVSRHQSAQSQNMADVVEVITVLGANFTKLIELMLSKEIKVSFFYFSRLYGAFLILRFFILF